MKRLPMSVKGVEAEPPRPTVLGAALVATLAVLPLLAAWTVWAVLTALG